VAVRERSGRWQDKRGREEGKGRWSRRRREVQD